MEYPTSSHAFVELARIIMEQGDAIQVRGFGTHELTHQHFSVTDPLARAGTVPGRNGNIFATVAETVWVLAGRNDLAFLARYLPRAIDYSDDGLVWRAGYGPRLRDWSGVDQLRSVADELLGDTSSRRAVIALFDPATDFSASRDIPCTNWLHPMVRNGRLDLEVVLRSNDLFWGFSGINAFEWSVLQELLAFWLGVEVGSTHYFVSSLHIYERHYERARNIVAQVAADPLPASAGLARFTTSMTDFDPLLQMWFEHEELSASGGLSLQTIEEFPDPLFGDFLRLMHVHACHRRGDTEGARAALADVRDSDLRRRAGTDLTRLQTVD